MVDRATLTVTGADLAGGLSRLADAVRKADPLAPAIAAIEASVPKTMARIRDDLEAAYVVQMVRQPWRIAQALGRPAFWPADDAPDVLLADCRRRIDGERGRIAARHWTADPVRLIHLKAAATALERIIAEGDTTPTSIRPASRERP